MSWAVRRSAGRTRSFFKFPSYVWPKHPETRASGRNWYVRLLSHARKYKVPRVAVYADKKSLPFFAHRGFRPMEKKDLPPGQCDCLDHYSESTLGGREA